MLKLDLPVCPTTAYIHCEAQWRAYLGAQRKGDALSALEDAVLSRYQEYLRHEGDPTKVGASPWPRRSILGDLLYGCYASGNGADRAIVEATRAVAKGYCPYCGLRLKQRPGGRNHESDHHLPRSVFPEFSVLSANLVTACHDCNEHKSNIYLTACGGRRFLHPYFDSCLSLQLLEADVRASRTGTPLVEFRLSPVALSCPASAIIAEHVEHLDVLERLSDEATEALVPRLQEAAARGEPVDETRKVFRVVGSAQLLHRPNDPLGLTLVAASQSPHLSALIDVAGQHLTR